MIKTILSNGLIQILTIVSSIALARYLGVEGRGNLAIIFFFPQLFLTLSLMGFDRGVSIAASRGEMIMPRLSIFLAALIFSIFSITASLFVVSDRILDHQNKELAFLYLTYIPPVTFFLLTSSFLVGIGDFGKYNLIRSSFYLTNLLSIIFILLTNVNPDSKVFNVVFANIIAGYVVGFLSFMFLGNSKLNTIRQLQDFCKNINKLSTTIIGGPKKAVIYINKFILSRDGSCKVYFHSFRDFLNIFLISRKFALPLFLAYICASCPQFLFVVYLSPADIGIAVINLTYSKLGSSVSSAIAVHIFQDGVSGKLNGFSSKFRKLIIIYFTFSCVLLVFSKLVITLAFGGEFFHSILFINFLVYIGFISQLSDTLSEHLRGRQVVKPDNISYILYLLAILVFGMILEVDYELIGLALAILIAEFCRFTSLLYHSHRLKYINFTDLIFVRSTDFNDLRSDIVFMVNRIFFKRKL